MKKSLVAVAVSALFAQSLMACDMTGKTGFLPENNRYIPVGLKGTGGINEIQFNRVMDKMAKLYTSTIEKTGNKLVIERRWSDGTVNAYAHRNVPGAYTIVMFGGLARHKAVTEDGMALVACHELGHHIGGAPRKFDDLGKPRWASNEGQSDYWGAMKCLSNYFSDEDNQTIVKSLNVPAEVVANCQLIYTNENESAVCQRVAMAGFSVGRLFNDLSGDRTLANFNTPDKKVVAKTYDAHPESQCRLDTYYAGALCDKDISITVSDNDENQGVCTTKNGDKVGTRPLCWFKPQP